MLKSLLILFCLLCAIAFGAAAQSGFNTADSDSFIKDAPAAQQPLQVVKAMGWSTWWFKHLSVGYEWQRGRYSTWNLNVGASEGMYPLYAQSGTFKRAAARIELRSYLLPMHKMRDGNHLNPFVAGVLGISYHAMDFDVDRPNRINGSSHIGAMVGEQVFVGRLAIDVACGLRGHAGGENMLANNPASAWTFERWLSPICHFQLGYAIGTGKRAAKKQLQLQ